MNKIIRDSVSGSTDLLIKTAKLFRKHYMNIAELKKLIGEAEMNLSHFSVITNYIRSIRSAITSKNNERIKQAVLAPLDRDQIYQQIFNNSLTLIKNVHKVFTLSNSRTILEIIKLLSKYHKGKLKVFLTESRPKLEGRISGRKLLKAENDLIFGTDVQMASFIKKSHAVFLGADKILKDGSIVNKTGSLSAAVIANYFCKPVYVFADTGKYSSEFREEGKRPDEVWRREDPHLTVVNNYFEKVPAELITRLITENEQHPKK